MAPSWITRGGQLGRRALAAAAGAGKRPFDRALKLAQRARALSADDA